MTPHLLCIGLGYSARALASRLTGTHWLVSGSSRSPSSDARLDEFALDLARDSVSDAEQNALRARLATATHLLVSVPPDDDGDRLLARLREALLDAPRLGSVIYLSTVGVYGDHAGGWVDENAPARPSGVTARRRLVAESQWVAFAEEKGCALFRFRLPGIYGPGTRNAFHALKQGTAHRIIKPGQVFNRIHVDDIASACLRAMADPACADIYNIVDDLPAAPEDVVTFAAQLMQMEPPPAIAFDRADLSPMAREFYRDCKRVRNTRMKTVLGVALKHPTYREGLRAIWHQMNAVGR